METRQWNKVSMSLAVLDVMDGHVSAWSGLPGLAAIVNDLETLVDSVQQKGAIQGTKRTGIAGGKNRRQVSMVKLVAALAGDLHTIAMREGDADLAAKTDVHKSDLLNLSDGEVGPACEVIVALAKERAADLAGFGTEAADIATAEEAVRVYKPLVAAPRVATVQNKTVTDDIATLLREIDALYEAKLDRVMRKFEAKNKPFFDDYQNARLIVNLGARHAPLAAAAVAAPA